MGFLVRPIVRKVRHLCCIWFDCGVVTSCQVTTSISSNLLESDLIFTPFLLVKREIWKSKTKTHGLCINVSQQTAWPADVNQAHVVTRGFEMWNIVWQMSKQADKLHKCAAWNDRLVAPNEMFKGNYRHNWRTLFILTFCNNYSRPEIKFYE